MFYKVPMLMMIMTYFWKHSQKLTMIVFQPRNVYLIREKNQKALGSQTVC